MHGVAWRGMAWHVDLRAQRGCAETISANVVKAPAKRSQHDNATHCNIVGRNMLRAFGHPVATSCDVLSVVGSNLTIFKPEPTTPNMSQHIATR